MCASMPITRKSMQQEPVAAVTASPAGKKAKRGRDRDAVEDPQSESNRCVCRHRHSICSILAQSIARVSLLVS